ncbi:MAG TPA: ABC transporter permease, partial [Acidimicrobiales bacterium]
ALASYQKGSVESSRRRFAIGGAVGTVGVLALVVGVAKPAIQLVGLGAMAIFLGVGMLAPLVARPISSALGRPLAAIFGISGKLGRENSIRSPRRTAQTASALMVGLALVSTFSVFGASISRSATSSINDAIVADYIITNPSVGGPQTGFSATTATVAARVPGVTTVTRVDGGMFEIGRSVRTIVAISPKDLSTTVVLRMASGAGTSALSHGELLIDTTTANSKGLKVGARIRATFAETGPTVVRIGGIFKPNAVLGSYVVGDAFFRSHFAVNTLPVALLLSTSRGANAETTAAIKAGLQSYPNLKIQTRAQFIKAQQAQVNQLLGLVYALLALAILVALIGIVNTLMLSVFERTREIGLLRAVGMRRRQVRAMIRSEAVILSVFGAVIGVVVGTGLGVALASSLKQQGITDVAVPYSSLVVFVAFAALLGFVAAAWPARRAARLEILQAIAVE